MDQKGLTPHFWGAKERCFPCQIIPKGLAKTLGYYFSGFAELWALALEVEQLLVRMGAILEATNSIKEVAGDSTNTTKAPKYNKTFSKIVHSTPTPKVVIIPV